MTLNESVVQNVRYAPHSIGTNIVIQGDVQSNVTGKTHLVEFSRRQHGWDVHLHITVDGVVIHDAPPIKQERDEWMGLLNRAEDAYEKERNAQQRERKAITALLFP